MFADSPLPLFAETTISELFDAEFWIYRLGDKVQKPGENEAPQYPLAPMHSEIHCCMHYREPIREAESILGRTLNKYHISTRRGISKIPTDGRALSFCSRARGWPERVGLRRFALRWIIPAQCPKPDVANVVRRRSSWIAAAA